MVPRQGEVLERAAAHVSDDLWLSIALVMVPRQGEVLERAAAPVSGDLWLLIAHVMVCRQVKRWKVRCALSLVTCGCPSPL